MIKILIGGSPCTFWSIAQKNNREVEAKGLGWELFKNYLIAKEKFQPDLFLYENNKSAAQPIKDQISRELGVELMHINSALVSAQNRQRFYAFNWDVEMPEDRGIVLTDILETQATEGGYELRAPAIGVGCRNRREEDGRLYRRFETSAEEKSNALTTVQTDSMVAEPIRIGDIGSNAQAHRVYSPEGKSVTLCAGGGGQGGKTGLYAVPFDDIDGKSHALTATYYKASENPDSQFGSEKRRQRIVQTRSGEDKPVYEVIDGKIEIKGKLYPIKLPDGLYIIRKLTPIECERLQTLPDNYTAAVSNTQRYKGLGNGWTAEVIIHILKGALKDVPRDEEIVVLSMYDGIGTGRYCLDKMGFTNVTYYSYEIDEPAMKVSASNYPDIIQCGDAFDLRRDDWELGKVFEKSSTPPTSSDEPGDNETDAGDDTDLSDAPTEIKEAILENDKLLIGKTDTDEIPLPSTDNGEDEGGSISEKAEKSGAKDEQSAGQFLRMLTIISIKAAIVNAGANIDSEFFEKLKTATPEQMLETIRELPLYIAALKTTEAMNQETNK